MVDTAAGTRVAVLSVRPLRERGQLAVQLENFDWEFPAYGPVDLLLDGHAIRARYVAFANVDGAPVLYLKPNDPRYPTMAQLTSALGTADARGAFHPAGSSIRRAG